MAQTEHMPQLRGVSEHDLTWEELWDAPLMHRQAVTYLGYGLERSQVSRLLSISEQALELLAEYPPARQAIADRQQALQCELKNVERLLDVGIERVLMRLNEIIEDPTTPPKVVVDIAKLYMDRHPSGFLAQQSKHKFDAKITQGFTTISLHQIRAAARDHGIDPEAMGIIRDITPSRQEAQDDAV